MTALNVQLARDEVAHVLGGTQVRAGVYSGAGALSAGGVAIKFAYGRVQEPTAIGNDGVLAIVMYEGTSVLGDGGDLIAYGHRLTIHLLLSVLRSTLHDADAILTPFIPVIRDAFAGKVKLGGAADANVLEQISEIKDSIYPGRMAIEFTLRVTQKEAVAFAA